METLVRLGVLLSPSFFAILAGLSLTAAVLLFVTGKSKGVDTQTETGKLSKSESVEHRYTVYLMLAFSWSMPGLILSLISGAIGIRPFWSPFLVILLLLCLLLALCFLYAGAGALLHAVTGQRIGFASRRFPPVRYIDDMIVWLGNVLTLGLLKQPKYTGGVTKDVVVGELGEVSEDVAAGNMPIFDHHYNCDSSGLTYNSAITVRYAEHLYFKDLEIWNVFQCDSNAVNGAITTAYARNMTFNHVIVHQIGQRGYWIQGGAWIDAYNDGLTGTVPYFDTNVDTTKWINCDTYCPQIKDSDNRVILT